MGWGPTSLCYITLLYSIIVLRFCKCPRSPLLLCFGLRLGCFWISTAPILCSIGHRPFRFMTFFPRTPGSVYWAISQSVFNIFGRFAQPVFNTFGCFALQPWAPDPTRGLCRAMVINNLCHLLLFPTTWSGFGGWGGTNLFLCL